MTPARFEAALAAALTGSRRGTVMLLEGPEARIDLRLLRAVRSVVGARELHEVAEGFCAVVIPGVGAREGLRSMREVRNAVTSSKLQVRVGAASWPMQGSTMTDLIAEAMTEMATECLAEPELEFEGAGELLTG